MQPPAYCRGQTWRPCRDPSWPFYTSLAELSERYFLENLASPEKAQKVLFIFGKDTVEESQGGLVVPQDSSEPCLCTFEVV